MRQIDRLRNVLTDVVDRLDGRTILTEEEQSLLDRAKEVLAVYGRAEFPARKKGRRA